jgi:hypothetical protein
VDHYPATGPSPQAHAGLVEGRVVGLVADQSGEDGLNGQGEVVCARLTAVQFPQPSFPGGRGGHQGAVLGDDQDTGPVRVEEGRDGSRWTMAV